MIIFGRSAKISPICADKIMAHRNQIIQNNAHPTGFRGFCGFTHVADTNSSDAKIVVDWNYFGPPFPGAGKTLKISPYWPSSLPWNPRDAKTQLMDAICGECSEFEDSYREKYTDNIWWDEISRSVSGKYSTDKFQGYYDLREIANLNQIGGIPAKLTCICEGDDCLLPTFNRICTYLKIVRIPEGFRKIEVAPEDIQWLILIPKINHVVHANALLRELSIATIQNIHYWYSMLQNIESIVNDVCSQWMISNDIETLAFAASIPGSIMFQRLVECCKKYSN